MKLSGAESKVACHTTQAQYLPLPNHLSYRFTTPVNVEELATNDRRMLAEFMKHSLLTPPQARDSEESGNEEPEGDQEAKPWSPVSSEVVFHVGDSPVTSALLWGMYAADGPLVCLRPSVVAVPRLSTPDCQFQQTCVVW